MTDFKLSKPILIIGGSGMLGQALAEHAKKSQVNIITLARNDSDISLDISNIKDLSRFDFSPYQAVINAAALTNIEKCQSDPKAANEINALPVKVLAEKTEKAGSYFVQISTDHYFSGHGAMKHSENAEIQIVNEYAKSKFEGENHALKNPHALVVRTNIVGFRGWKEQNTFVEWVLAQLESGESFIAYTDFYTSSLDVGLFSKALFDLILRPQNMRPTGILNLASSEVASKKEFIEALALRGGFDLKSMILGSIKDHSNKNNPGVKRADSLGLDVRKCEEILGYSLPGLVEVVNALFIKYKDRKNAL